MADGPPAQAQEAFKEKLTIRIPDKNQREIRKRGFRILRNALIE
jgi:hypothetical protein